MYAFEAKVSHQSEWCPGHRGRPGRSTTLRRCSGASGAPCYFPVIQSRSPGPSRYHQGPPSTEVHSVTTDVRIRSEARCVVSRSGVRGVGGIRGGPRRYGNNPGHREPLVISLLFHPGALDHRAIIRDLLLRRCIRRRLTYAFEARCGVGRSGIGSGVSEGPRQYGDAPGCQETLVICILFDPRALDHRAIVGNPFNKGVPGVWGSTMIQQCSRTSGASCYLPIIPSLPLALIALPSTLVSS